MGAAVHERTTNCTGGSPESFKALSWHSWSGISEETVTAVEFLTLNNYLKSDHVCTVQDGYPYALHDIFWPTNGVHMAGLRSENVYPRTDALLTSEGDRRVMRASLLDFRRLLY